MGCGSSRDAAPPVANGRRGGGAGGGHQPPLGRGDPSNTRVRPSPPWAEPQPLTQQQLSMKRAAFWESQPSGSAVIWSNLKLAAEAMIAGDYELASTVLEAADIRVPYGDLSVAYDARGGQYTVPRWGFSNPTNILSDDAYTAAAAAAAAAAAGGKGGAGGGAFGGPGGARRPYAGPLAELPPLVCRIAATPSTGEQDVRLGGLTTGDTVGSLKAALHEHLRAGRADVKPEPAAAAAVAAGGTGGSASAAATPATTTARGANAWAGRGLPPARQRVMFRGRELPDESYLGDAGLGALGGGCTVQIFVRLPPMGQPE